MGTGIGVLVHELPGVGDQADIERVGDRRRQLDIEQGRQVVDDLRGAGGVDVDEVDGPETSVVVVVIDVDHLVVAVLQEIRGHPVDVPAVQEHHRAVGDVCGRLVEDLLEGQESVLHGEWELLGGQEHHGVLAQPFENPVHPQERTEGVAVRVLVGGQQESVADADRIGNTIDVARQ
jgi:hypothetical protein